VATNAAARTGRRVPDISALPSGTPRWLLGLQAGIRGSISVPGMPNYEAARGGGNPRYLARPAAVVFCATEQDVRMSLLAAQDQGIAFRVRSGRHCFAGFSNVDDGLVIDVRQLQHVTVDRVARTATVGTGTNLGELNSALDAYMLHVPAGTWSTVGIAGFMHGGGYSWTTRRYGMNCDCVAAVRLMLADGRIIRATRDVNTSLMWAVCGGAGGNFGVLLDVTYDLADLCIVWGFALQWPIEHAPQVLAAMQEGFTRGGEAPDELGYRAVLQTSDGKQILVMYGMFLGDRETGTEVLAPLTAIGACTTTIDMTDTYAAVNDRLLGTYDADGNALAGFHGARRSGFVVRQLGIDGWDAVVEHFRTSPSAHTLASFSPYGGQAARIAPDDCAFVHRAVDMNASGFAMWKPGSQDAEARAWDWANGFVDILEPFRDGSVYQNLPERGLANYRTAYWGSNFAKLLAVKQIADPYDVFTHPQGISPDPSGIMSIEQPPELEPEPYMTNGYGLDATSVGGRFSNAEPSSPHTNVDDLRRTTTTEPGSEALRQRVAELSDLGRAGVVLAWDQQVTMPAGGGPARAAVLGTLERLAHEKLVGPDLTLLLAVGDPDDPIVRVVGRDHERARRVPAQLTEEIIRAGSDGLAAWLDARASNDFGRFEPALRRNVWLAREYADCFPESEHPYDALLDRYEPGATTAEVGALLERVCHGLAPLLVDLAAIDVPEPLAGPFPVTSQRSIAHEIAAAMGFEAESFRLDDAVHPFACATATTDIRVAARFDEGDLTGLLTFMHEMGHALYERGIDPALARTGLDVATSMGVHESQSRLWENMVGRGEPFWNYWLPRLREAMPLALSDVSLDDYRRSINAVRPGLIRVEADEVTYALHILLRFELEVQLVEGTLDPADLPAAWEQRTRELLGITVPDDLHGVLQDIHWAQGAIGYFPTYGIGNVLAAQMWFAMRADLPGIDDDLRSGDYFALCEWLRERVHRHGRLLPPAELRAQAVGGPLDAGPLLVYLDAKYRALYGIA
jgi:carboxypeptidase Taq